MKKVVAVLLAAFATISFVSTPAFADKAIGLDTGNDACTNWDQNDPNYDIICGGGDEGDAQNRVKGILNTVFLWVGIIAVAVMIIGGMLLLRASPQRLRVQKTLFSMRQLAW